MQVGEDFRKPRLSRPRSGRDRPDGYRLLAEPARRLDVGLNFAKQQNRTQYNFQSNALSSGRNGQLPRIMNPASAAAATSSDLRNDVTAECYQTIAIASQFLHADLRISYRATSSNSTCAPPLAGCWGTCSVIRTTTSSSPMRGVVWNRERYSSEATVDRTGNSAEAVIGTQINFFPF